MLVAIADKLNELYRQNVDEVWQDSKSACGARVYSCSKHVFTTFLEYTLIHVQHSSPDATIRIVSVTKMHMTWMPGIQIEAPLDASNLECIGLCKAAMSGALNFILGLRLQQLCRSLSEGL